VPTVHPFGHRSRACRQLRAARFARLRQGSDELARCPHRPSSDAAEPIALLQPVLPLVHAPEPRREVGPNAALAERGDGVIAPDELTLGGVEVLGEPALTRVPNSGQEGGVAAMDPRCCP
jgi:hypothetical protein